jgi:NTE family protein
MRGETAESRGGARPPFRKGNLALCLSGGGYRTALFHAGTLLRLNEMGVLKEVEAVSSVSGGSVINGVLAKHWIDLKWEGGVATNLSEAVISKIIEVTSRDIRTPALLTNRLLKFWDWTKLASEDYSAADLLQEQYEKHLFGGLRLAELPESPEFIFCATNLQTGANWEFSGRRIGDYQVGYMGADGLRVSEAVAASSAFPLAFPPLVLRFDSSRFAGGNIAPGLHEFRERVLVTDGGVYDNLGLEPVWKNYKVVIVSDGGKPFFLSQAEESAIVHRLSRCQDIIGGQVVSLRKRMLIAKFTTDQQDGAYFGLRSDHRNYDLPDSMGYAPSVIDRLEQVRTDFNEFSEGEKFCLINHGYALADAAVRKWVPQVVRVKRPAIPPHSEHFTTERAMRELAV